MIEARGLFKNFGTTSAVSGLTFTINQGEIFGIVGPDGSGKSTLLRLIASILTPTQGSVTIKGTDVHTHAFFIKENLAYMPQRFGLYEDLTVEENLFFFGRLFGVSKKNMRERMKRLYAFSRLEPFKDRLAGKLSGGMKQKLGLACSLIHSPELILLDEPTNGVDPVSRREFWKILYELLADGVTIVVSTAYLDEAERCTRIGLMYAGKFMTIGTPSEVKKSMGKTLIEVRADDVWKAELAMRSSESYSNVMRESSRLRIFTDDPAAAEKEIPGLLKKAGISRITVERTKPTLENCFIEIIAGGAK